MRYLLLFLSTILVGAQFVEVVVPKGQSVRMVQEDVPFGFFRSTSNSTERVYGDDLPPGFKQTNVAKSLMPPDVVPMSVKMRMAAQLARNQAAPWTTRFVATRVDEKPLSSPDKDEQGLPNGKTVWTTNYIVTLQPIPINETNEPVAFGATKTGLLRMRVEFPIKVGDKLDLAPVPPPGALDPR